MRVKENTPRGRPIQDTDLEVTSKEDFVFQKTRFRLNTNYHFNGDFFAPS